MSELSPKALAEISARTLGHYGSRADAFWEGTRDHDVRQNVEALLDAIEGAAPFRILDLGCGPCRDLAAFKALGHEPTGLDGTEAFCVMARAYAGCPVLQQDFLALDLPAAHFHGVFANATLFHVPVQELSRVLGELRAALVPRGVLFSSNPRGKNEEGWYGDDRFASYHDYPSWKQSMEAAGFTEVQHYYRPAGRPRAEQPWLASVWRKS